jgi:recombination protein RecR
MSDPRTELAELLRQLPGVGARQAARFAAYIRFKDKYYAQKISQALLSLHDGVHLCEACCCMHADRDPLCKICRTEREPRLMIVANDVDKDALERSGAYRGYYFVLGGTIPILDRDPHSRIRLAALRTRIQKLNRSQTPLDEVTFGFAANPEGDNTESFLRTELETWYPDAATRPRMTRLARGISTGTEIEYADPDTLEAALKRRQ